MVTRGENLILYNADLKEFPMLTVRDTETDKLLMLIDVVSDGIFFKTRQGISIKVEGNFVDGMFEPVKTGQNPPEKNL